MTRPWKDVAQEYELIANLQHDDGSLLRAWLREAHGEMPAAKEKKPEEKKVDEKKVEAKKADEKKPDEKIKAEKKQGENKPAVKK